MKKNQNKISLKNYQFADKFGALLGYRIIKVDRSRSEAKVAITLREDHLSPAGRIHGGVISAFLDFACGAAVFSTMGSHDFCSTVEIKVNYFKPLNAGDLLVSHSKVIFRGNRLCVVHAPVFIKGQKSPAAFATATFNIVAKKG